MEYWQIAPNQVWNITQGNVNVLPVIIILLFSWILNDLFNLMQSYQTGNHGEEEKDTLCDGDLIIRQDWPDANDDLQQL